MDTENDRGDNGDVKRSSAVSQMPVYLRVLSNSSVLITALIGLLALAGWIFGLPSLASLGAGLIPVAPSTALLFLLYAAAVFMRLNLSLGRKLRLAAILAGVAGAIVSLSLFVLSLKGVLLDIEHLGISIINVAGEMPKGHMSPITAFCFLIASISFLSSLSLSSRSWGAVVAILSASLLIAANSVFVIAYMFGVPFLYGGRFIPPALLTVVAFITLGFSLLSLSWPEARRFQSRTGPTSQASFAFILIFILLAAGVITAGYLSYSRYEKHLRHEVDRQLTAIADLKTDELVNWKKERMDDGNIFYMNGNFSGLVQQYLERPGDRQIRDRLHVWLKHIRGISHYDRIYLLDGRGELRLAEPEDEESVSRHVSQKSMEVLQEGKIVFEDFHRDETDGHIYLGLLVPVIEKQGRGRPLAVLVMHIDPENYLYPFIRRWPVPSRTAETLLIRREGEEVLFLNQLKFGKDIALNLRKPLSLKDLPAAQAVLGRKGIIEGRDYRGVPVIADMRAVPDSPWFLITKMDVAEVYAPLKERLWLIAGFVSVLLLGSGAGVGLVWRQQSLLFYRQRYESSEEIELLNSRLRILIESIKELASARDLDAIQQIVRSAARRLTGADGAAVVYREGDNCYYADEDAIGPLWKSQKFPMSACISGWAMLNRQSVVIEDIYADERIPAQAYRPTFVKSLVMVPINTTEPIGAIGNYWATHHRATEMEVQLLQTLADAASRAIENVRLYESLEQRVADRTAQLEAANKELEGFSYSVSHDLRAPLRHITGFAELLIKKAPAALDEKSRHYLDVISEAATQMGKLVDDLLSFSRMGRAEMVHAKVDIDKVVADTIGLMNPDLKGRDVFWNIGSLPDAYGDPLMLKIVFENLISNALKFTCTRQQAVIEIGSEDRENEVIFFVKDNGVGFDMKYADKLFGLFQRLHRSEEFEGTGLGLANVRRIIHRHGGRTWAEGKTGEGATIFFSLHKTREV